MSTSSDAFDRAKVGALFGAAVGAICLVIGIIRIALVLIFGTRFSMPTADDVLAAAFYVGGFAISGIVVGVLWPLTTRTLGRFLVSYVAVAPLMMVCGAIVEHTDVQTLFALRRYWVIVGMMTLIFGTALALKLGGSNGEEPPAAS